MKVLLSCIHYPMAAGRYMFWALRRMGHEVVTVGPAVGPYLPWATHVNLEPFEWKPDVPLSQEGGGRRSPVKDVTARLLEKPDLILQMDAQFLLGGKADCPNVLYAIDNHLAPYGAYDDFDKLFLAHSWGYMSELAHASWLPCGYDPAQHFVIDEGTVRPFDCAMVGVGYPKRTELVAAVRASGVKVYAITGALYGEYNTIYNAAKVALVRSSCGDVAMRVFENMAQGCVVVCDRAKDLAACGFVEGVHYLGYDTPAECVAQVKRALATYDTEGAAMVATARDAVKRHRWEDRAASILEAVNL